MIPAKPESGTLLLDLSDLTQLEELPVVKNSNALYSPYIFVFSGNDLRHGKSYWEYVLKIEMRVEEYTGIKYI